MTHERDQLRKEYQDEIKQEEQREDVRSANPESSDEPTKTTSRDSDEVRVWPAAATPELGDAERGNQQQATVGSSSGPAGSQGRQSDAGSR